MLKQFTKGFARTEKKTYNPFGDIKTVYYDAQDNVMATVYDVKSMGKHNHLTLSTKDKDFIDWSRRGVVDCYDEDKLVEVPKKMQKSTFFNNPILGPREIVRSV